MWSGLVLIFSLIVSGVWLWHYLDAQHVADWGNPWLNRLDGLNRVLCKKFHRLQHAELVLPDSGGVLVVANHVSGLDPLLMLAASPRPLRFVIAQDEYDRWWLKWLFKAIGCIPIGKLPHRTVLNAVKEALTAGEAVALFPQGGIFPDHQPIKLKRGILLVAEMTGAPICPLRLEGIRGLGKKVSAVFLRSRARIVYFAPRYYKDSIPDQFLKELGDLLSGKGQLS